MGRDSLGYATCRVSTWKSIKMKCPYCGKNELKTLETRESAESVTRRRKECASCGRRITTYETIDLAPLMVIKKDGSKQAFDRQKVVSGLVKACEKRDIDYDKIEAITDEIVNKIHSLGRREIKSSRIGLYVVNKLRKIDSIAYLRFASVYRDFDAIEHFEKEINKLQKVS